MSHTGTTLAIDWWHTRLAAALRTPDGRLTPLAIDGAVTIPTGVAITADATIHTGTAAAVLGQRQPQSYIRIPGQRLHDDHIAIGGAQIDPVDAAATVLSTVTDAASRAVAPGRVVIATPAGWTTRQRTRLRAAAIRAGLNEPELVSGPEAIARQHHGNLGLTAGQVVAVIRLDTTVGELALLQPTASGCDLLAAIDLGELGEQPGATLVDQATAALADALDAAGVPVARLGAVLCDAPPDLLPALTTALTATAGAVPPPLVHAGELAAALGAAARTDSVRNPRVANRAGWSLIRAGITGTVAFTTAGVLTVQQMKSGTVYPATSTGPQLLVLQWYGWGLAPIFALLGAVAFACLSTDLRALQRRTAPTGPAPGLGTGLMATAAAGLVAATTLGLLGGANYQVTPAPILRWTLLSTAPLAAILAMLGIVVTRAAPPGQTWTNLLHPPMTAVLIAAGSTVLLIATYTAVPRINSDLWWTTEHLAAFGLGWAVALLLTDDRWRRLLLGALLSAAATYAIDINTATAIVTCVIVTVTIWAALRLARAVSSTIGRRVDAAGTAALTPLDHAQ